MYQSFSEPVPASAPPTSTQAPPQTVQAPPTPVTPVKFEAPAWCHDDEKVPYVYRQVVEAATVYVDTIEPCGDTLNWLLFSTTFFRDFTRYLEICKIKLWSNFRDQKGII